MSAPLHDASAPRGRKHHAAWTIIAATLAVSVVLGVVLWWQYRTFLRYVHDHLNGPEAVLAWENAVLSPEDCVDETMAWSARCSGIKSLCDMYAGHVMERCLASQDRSAYCDQVAGQAALRSFGAQECRARGARRNVDSEACSAAYKTVEEHCRFLRQRREAGLAPEAGR